MAIVQAFTLLSCDDPVVQRIAWDSLRAVVQIKIGRKPSNEDLVAFLNGETSGEGGPKSFWTRVRRSTAAIRKVTQLRWDWPEVHQVIEIVIPKPNDEPDVVRVHPCARRLLCQQIKTVVRDPPGQTADQMAKRTALAALMSVEAPPSAPTIDQTE